MRTAIYCRISQDRDGSEAGVTRQEEDCRALAAERGWEVVEVYTDNDVSASSLSRKPRVRYEQMLEDARNGRFEAVTFYSNSRLTRRPREWEQVIELAQKHKIRLASVKSGAADLTTADGRAVARTIAAWDAAEAERTGERVSRAHEQRRAQGRAHGGHHVFGYLKPDASQGIGYTTHIDPEAQAAIRQAAEIAVLEGSLTSIQKAWNAAGVLTVNSGPWNSLRSIQRVLMNPRIAGLVAHKGEVVGEGDWPAVIDRPTWEAMCTAIAPKKGGPGSHNARKYLLSGYVFCGSCGHRMEAAESSGTYSKGKRAGTRWTVNRYACYSSTGGCGKVTRNKTWLETYVKALVGRALQDAPPREHAVSGADHSAEIARLEADIAATRADMLSGAVPRADGFAYVTACRARVVELQREQAQWARAAIEQSARPPLEVWQDERPETLEARRAILGTVVRSVEVLPLPRGFWTADNLPLDSVRVHTA
ncbi:recombinase-like zinc beta ribbon protein [Motilibacter rhizosphaerae]|uniref:Recombinase-like zinc beta ribbon protein n=1 Tax=Motilibacter rhizosphaerae TaxID=598652 RepID=A0A4Q7NB49_9ACTN|nr:recombinase-like zinc beta ribbon protein [Motilibacter rhizosphaerae]